MSLGHYILLFILLIFLHANEIVCNNNSDYLEIPCIEQTGKHCSLERVIITGDKRFRPISKNPKDVTHFEIKEQKIQVITNDICKTFPNLIEIQLEHLFIEEIEENAFQKCKKLERIFMKTNQIRSLPKNIFNQNKNLEIIELEENLLSNLHVDLFKNLKHLGKLFLSFNEITYFPPVIVRDLQNLSELSIDGNKLLDLDADGLIKALPKLEVINFDDNDFLCDRIRNITKIFMRKNVILKHVKTKDKRWRSYGTQDEDSFICLDNETWEMKAFQQQSKVNFAQLDQDVHGNTNKFIGILIVTLLLVIVVAGIGYLVYRINRKLHSYYPSVQSACIRNVQRDTEIK